MDPSQVKAVVYTTSFGIVAERWDKVAYHQDTMKLLEDAEVTNVRVPGGGGVDALYHWTAGSIINLYTDDRAPAFPKERMFPAMVATMDQLGSGQAIENLGSTFTVEVPRYSMTAIAIPQAE